MIDKLKFFFRANVYKDYFVSFHLKEKSNLGILGYMNEDEICIVHKGMSFPKDAGTINGFIKRRGYNEKITFQGTVVYIQNNSHKERNYTFIWLKFNPPVILSEQLIAIQMANYPD